MPVLATHGSGRASRRARVPLMLLAALLLCTGCYQARWSAAGRQPTPAGGIDGRWTGTWRSTASGHSGGLRCIVSEVTPHTFKADFQASYAWLFTFSYQATMRIKAADPATRPGYAYFAGEQNLGWLAGGLYTYDGKVGTTEFFCDYRSKDDRGTFQMTRPGGEVGRE